MMKRKFVLSVAVVAALLAAPYAFAQANDNTCPQDPAEVDFITINQTAAMNDQLFGFNDDGGSAGDAEAIPSTYVEVLGDDIPDIMALALLEMQIKEGSEFYMTLYTSHMNACEVYQANYAQAYADIAAAELGNLLPGADEVVAALITLDEGWAPLIQQFIRDYNAAFETFVMTPGAYADIPALAADGDADLDTILNLAEWDNLNATWYDGGGDLKAWKLPGQSNPTTAAQALNMNRAVYAQFGANALAGPVIIVTVSPSLSSVFPTQQVELTASSNAGVFPNEDDPETGVTWASSDTSIATVESTGAFTAEVNALSLGFATITATGVVHPTKSGTATISVERPAWTDLCMMDDVFEAEGNAAAAVLGPMLGQPSDWWEFNLDGMAGDTVPDAYQLALLAYTLCQESEFYVPVSKTDSANVVSQWMTNYAAVTAFTQALADTPDYIDGLGANMVTAGTAIATVGASVVPGELATLEAVLTGILQAAGLDDPPGMAAFLASQMIGAAAAGVPMQTAGATFAGMGPVLVGMLGSSSEFAGLGPVLNDVPELITAFWGLSTEMKTVWEGVLASISLPDAISGINDLAELSGGVEPPLYIYGVLFAQVAANPGTLGVACPTALANAAAVIPAGIYVSPSDAPGPPAGLGPGSLPDSWTPGMPWGAGPHIVYPITVEIFGTGSKLGDEPFSGAGDWDGDEVSNEDVWDAVSDCATVPEGGLMAAFVQGATNEDVMVGAFWPCNPGVPAASVLGLAALTGALALAYARRKK